MPRMTLPTQLVLRALLANLDAYGLEIMRTTGLPGGTIYPILQRLETAGWAQRTREDVNPVAEGRPPRHYWRLTDLGRAEAAAALDRVDARTAKLRRAVRPRH